MKTFNYIFYFLIFVGFFLPTNSNFYIPLPGLYLKFNELAFIALPLVNMFCKKEGPYTFKSKRLSKYILFLIVFMLISETILKNAVYDQSLGGAFKGIRIGLPLFSSLILLRQGIRPDIKIVWNVLLWAITTSVLLSLISMVIPLPIYYNLEVSSTSLLEERQGRLANSNAPFCLIGLYLLLADKDKWYNQGRLVKIASALSVFAMVLTFNRTYLAIMALEIAFLLFKNFRIKQLVRALLYSAVFLSIGLYAYNTVGTIQRQVDKRILSILKSETTIYESTVSNNREHIYEGALTRVEDGHWALGLPYHIPIFVRQAVYTYDDDVEMTRTDTSVINMVLRYGIVPSILLVLVFRLMYRFSQSRFYQTCFILYLLASLNVDSLVVQNSIFFLIIIYFISIAKEHEEHSVYSKN